MATVKDLKNFLNNFPDDTQVIVPILNSKSGTLKYDEPDLRTEKPNPDTLNIGKGWEYHNYKYKNKKRETYLWIGDLIPA